jgi:hypothetical protein
VEVLDALDRPVPAGQHPAIVEEGIKPLVEDLVHERALAGARDAGDAGEQTERDGDVDLLQVVLLRAAHHEVLAAPRASLRPAGDPAPAAQVLAGQ